MQIIIKEEEILQNPNNFDLGDLVRKKYNNIKETMLCADGVKTLVVNKLEEGILNSEIINIDSSYVTHDGYDKCVICGEKTPYKVDEHIKNRIGYIEGVGQSCYQPNMCK